MGMAPKITSSRAAQSRRYYTAHREEIAAKRQGRQSEINRGNRTRRQQYLAYVAEQKNRPCADCGQEYPYYVMDLDHVRGKKVKNVAAMVAGGYSLEAIQEEIDKCDIVCSNCHRKRTHIRKNG